MRICRYGDDRLGIVDGSSVRDVTPLQSEVRQRAPYAYMGDPLVAFLHSPDNRKRLAEQATASAPIPLSSVRLLAPVVRPTKVIAAPTNYQKHIDEMAPISDALGLRYTAKIAEDGLFLKANSAIVGPTDPDQLPLELRLNGEVRQKSNTSELIYGFKRLIEFASSFYTLYPGDLIYTGTPDGVGPVKAGDMILVTSAAPLGTLEVAVRARTPAA
jgi:2-keto-4-pentenoate hydratase/2-oxohepta-3-ene-1,7-dioic acid hydratase in catechol pathway